jgi:drug/metabolite transporter (DMT)-like permease
MNGALTTLLAASIGFVAGFLAAAAPDPGEQDFAALTALMGGLVLTAVALARREGREEAQWQGFIGAFLGGVLGFLVYLFGLITGLY